MAEALRLLAIFLSPFIPTSSNQINSQLGLGNIEIGDWTHAGTWGRRRLTRVVAGPVIFPRIVEP